MRARATSASTPLRYRHFVQCAGPTLLVMARPCVRASMVLSAATWTEVPFSSAECPSGDLLAGPTSGGLPSQVIESAKVYKDQFERSVGVLRRANAQARLCGVRPIQAVHQVVVLLAQRSVVHPPTLSYGSVPVCYSGAGSRPVRQRGRAGGEQPHSCLVTETSTLT